ncbi:hypothetical protein [Primorskyibacter sp. 2E233]|uniref:hypothetical protein n=1 Tax=Primorskyibacter sp. 2E233 TaxID=3413431 RepID=UPI003BF25718
MNTRVGERLARHGELSTWESVQMPLHMAMCKGCGAFVQQMRMAKDTADHAIALESAEFDDEARITDILAQLHGSKSTGS